MSLNGSTNEQRIWNYLIAKGLSPCGAAGLMGNIQAESGFSPTNLQNSFEKKLGYTDATYTAAVDDGSYTNFIHDGAGYGLCQWTFWSLKQALQLYARAAGRSIGDLEMQLDYMMESLSSYKGMMEILKTASTVKAASDFVLLNYERPADQGETAKAKRASFGQAILEKYATTAQKGSGPSMSGKITTGKQLAERALWTAQNFKTLYVMGCFGAPLNAANKTRYCNNHQYNRNADRQKMIKAASDDTFGFDCVCLIKGLLWGWSGDKTKTYGGAGYAINGVPDIGADSMIKVCSGVTTDFSHIEVGEAVWLSGHIGIYIGDGLAVECTPKWQNRVQVTAVSNIGAKSGYNARKWTKHGKLPYVTYDGSTSGVVPSTPAAPSTPQADPPKTVKPEAAMYFDKSIARAYTVKAKSGLNIRAGAGTNKALLTTLKNGTTVRCYGYYNKVGSTIWLYVAVNGITGYVCKDYLV